MIEYKCNNGFGITVTKPKIYLHTNHFRKLSHQSCTICHSVTTVTNLEMEKTQKYTLFQFRTIIQIKALPEFVSKTF